MSLVKDQGNIKAVKKSASRALLKRKRILLYILYVLRGFRENYKGILKVLRFVDYIGVHKSLA